MNSTLSRLCEVLKAETPQCGDCGFPKDGHDIGGHAFCIAASGIMAASGLALASAVDRLVMERPGDAGLAELRAVIDICMAAAAKAAE